MSNEVAIIQESTAVAKIDNGKPALYNPAAFDQIWRASKLFASSDLVPTAYKGKPENCFIAIEMADRMGISPFAMLQSLVIIQGKPSMEAKLIIALVNDSGIFADPLEYEIVGGDPHAQDYKVRCFATMKKTGKVCYGPWITYQMVKGEGWLDKGGSKWKTMPSIMYMYRAASFFAKVYCPNITMGMQTREEMEDITPVNITPERQPAPALVAPLAKETQDVQEQANQDAPALVAPQTEAVIQDAEIVTGEEVVNTITGEVTEPPPQPKPEPAKVTRKNRPAPEVAPQATQQAPPPQVAPPQEDDFPEPPGSQPAPELQPEEGEMGDLF